jgi:hypothetical protein
MPFGWGRGARTRAAKKDALAAPADVRLAPAAVENGLASMMADLVRQNLDAKPHKKGDFAALAGLVAIVAEDADVALTMRFEHGGKLVIEDGIVGIPDVTIRGPAEVIMALSNMPHRTPLGLPIPARGDDEAARALATVFGAVRRGAFHIYGLALHPGIVMKLGTVMSIHG